MSVYVMGNFLLYCVINAFTPGPGNILALNTVTTVGWRRGRPLFLGVFAGYYGVQALCAALVYSVGAVLPGALDALKYLGAAYILWLSVRVALSKPGQGGGGRPASFAAGFALQLVNVKIYLFGITALTGYIVRYSTSFAVLLFFEMVIATIGTAATLTWIGLGLLLQDFYRGHYRGINLLLAMALWECVTSMLS